MKKASMALIASYGIAILGVGQAWAKDPTVKSKKEAEAFQAMQTTLQSSQGNPDAQLKAVDEFLTKFADTEFKVILLQNAMQISQQKRDPALTITYAERVLEADPKNFEADVTIASETAGAAKEFDLDKAEKTAKVQKYAQAALANVKDYPKPISQIPDDQWEQQKKSATAQAHVAMGMMAMANKKYDEAITEMKTAVDTAPDPIATFRLGEAYLKANKLDEANASFDKVLSMPDTPASVKTYATQRKADIAKLKASGSK